MSIRNTLMIIAFAMMFVLTAEAAEAQDEPAAWLAVRQCEVKPTESGVMRTAFAEFVEYAVANTPDLPGNVYGSFRQRVWGDAHFTTIYEVANIGEYFDLTRGRRQVMADDARWRELWQAWNSHLVPQSCDVSFHQRWP